MERRKIEAKQLPVRLRSDELDSKRDELAELLAKQAQLESEKKESARRFKDRLEEVKEKMTELAEQIRSREEYRLVDCYVEPNYLLRTMDTYREDTFEKVCSRAMKPHEMTPQLPFKEAKDEEVEEEEKEAKEEAKVVEFPKDS